MDGLKEEAGPTPRIENPPPTGDAPKSRPSARAAALFAKKPSKAKESTDAAEPGQADEGPAAPEPTADGD